jgi:hypothetical protein
MTVKQAISRANERYKTNAKLASECVCMEPKTALKCELEEAENAYHNERIKFIEDLRLFNKHLEELNDKITKLENMLKGE